ncbi:Retrovirus-related Pol polyprotein from transposon 17.6, partial [Mucuna pruriens]
MHKILLEEEARPVRQPQRKEVMKVLSTGIIYPILDNQWVSLMQIVPKKSGMTVVKYQNDELEAKQATCKDHFPLPFIDQVLERLVTCRFILHSHINIRPLSPARSAHFPTQGCCLTYATPQTPSKESCMEVFIDDFTVYGHSFDACLESLSRVLDRCIETNLVLNFEKCHFMVTKGIVLGHLVSNRGIEVNKAKIDIIASLSHLVSMQEICSFLGHDVEFIFDQPCIEAFEELKKRLTTTPILQAFY